MDENTTLEIEPEQPEPADEPQTDSAPTDTRATSEASAEAPRTVRPTRILRPWEALERLDRQWEDSTPLVELDRSITALSLTTDEDPRGWDYLGALTGASPRETANACEAWLEAQLAADAVTLGRAVRPRVELVPAGRLWYVVRTIADIIIVIDGPGYPTPLAAAVAASRRYRAELLRTLEGAQETAVDVPPDDATDGGQADSPGNSRAPSRRPRPTPNTPTPSPMATKFTPAWLESHRVDVSSLRRADVVGIGHVLGEIDALVARLRDPDRAAAMGLKPPRGILLHGEPGLGKTLTARYLAASLGPDVPFYEISADELTPERVRGALRHLAGAYPRSVLYADEIDTIGMARDFSGHDSDTRMRLTALLAALDGLTATDGPVVIASSNRPPYVLDAALTRSGRLGFKVGFDAPDEDERIELFMLFTRQVPTSPAIDWRHAARLTRGKSPADLRQIIEDAASLALVADRDVIDAVDVVTAIRRDGRIEPEPDDPEDVRHRIAIHEAGHVAVCVALRGPRWVYSVRLGVTEGHTSFGDERVPRAMRADDENRDAIVVSFGGVAAERAILGEAASGGGSDVSAATGITLERVGAGLSDEVSPIDLAQLERNVAETLKTALAVDLTTQVEAARAIATSVITANVDSIQRFAASLEAAGELTGEALETAIADAGFVGDAGR